MFGSHRLILPSLFTIIISCSFTSGLRVHSFRKQYSVNNSRIPTSYSGNSQIEQRRGNNGTLPIHNVTNFPLQSTFLSSKIVKSRERRTSKEEYASYASQLFAKYNPLCDRRARAVVSYAGSSLMLACDLCGYVKEGAVWTKLPLQAYGQEKTETVLYDEVVIPAVEHYPGMEASTPFYMEDLALGISGVTHGSAGIYQCKTEKMLVERVIGIQPLSFYYVEVKPLRSIKEINLDLGQGPRVDGPVEGTKPPIFIYTAWSLWGQCSECDLPGIRRRLGYCYALVDEEAFAGGVPCGSNLVPPVMVSDLATYIDQQLVIPCRTRCSDQVSASPFDDNTNPLNVAGSHYYKKRIDDIQTIRMRQGSQARLHCPEAYIQDVVWWRKGPDKLFVPIERPSLIKEEHTSRVFMDPDGSLLFLELRLNDSDSYRCDVNDRMTANYRLYVYEAMINPEETKRAISVLTVVIAVYISLFGLVILLRFYLKSVVQAQIKKMQEEARLDLDEDLEEGLIED